MYIESEEHLSQLCLALEDVKGVWPNLALLPRVSSMWKRNEEKSYSDEWGAKNVYEVKFDNGSTLLVCELDGDVQIFTEER